MEEHRGKKLLMLAVLGTAGGSIYLIPFIRYVFYDWQISAMALTNTQIGLLTSIYGVFCVALYVPGGILADKFSPKLILEIELIATTIVTVIIAFTLQNGFHFQLFMWVLLALGGAIFWAPLFKEMRMIAGEKHQGFYFGFYYMCNGLTGAIVNWVALKIAAGAATANGKFFICVIVYAVSTAIALLLVMLVIREKNIAEVNPSEDIEKIETNEFKWSQVGGLLKNPMLWVFSLIVLTGYMIYSSSSYFTPYLTSVVGITPSDSGYLSIVRTYIFYILTPVSGLVADKVFKSTSKWFIVLFAILTALYFGVMLIPAGASVAAVSFYTLLPGLFGLALYGIQFSIASESGIPVILMGTATGVASIIGYSSDIWMSTLFGHWLDTSGNSGYNTIFIFLGVCCIIGLACSITIWRHTSKAKKLGNQI